MSLAGYDARGEPFVMLEFLFGSWGGRPFADGPDGVSSVVVNFANNPAEVIEAEHPIAIDRTSLCRTAGATGSFAGGLAVKRHYRMLAEQTTLNLRSDRRTRGPYGLQGGEAGATSSSVLVRNGERIELAGKGTTALRRGDVFEHRTAGGGGWVSRSSGRLRRGSGIEGRGRLRAERGRRPERRSRAHIRVFFQKTLEAPRGPNSPEPGRAGMGLGGGLGFGLAGWARGGLREWVA